MAVLFWTLTALVVYVYAGYPLLLALVGAIRARPTARGANEPSVTLLISAFNEAATSSPKNCDNSLNLDYPADRLQIVVILTLPTTTPTRSSTASRRSAWRLLRMADRGGKTSD